MQQIERREFLQNLLSGSVGLGLGFYLPAGQALAKLGTGGDSPLGSGFATQGPLAFVHVGPDNKITFVCNKLEMGQGVYTSMAQIIVEELDGDFSKVETISAPVLAVYNHPIFKSQMTGGSSSITSSYQQLRELGAGLRHMIVQAAAQKWKVPASELSTELSFVKHKTRGKLSYGELASSAKSFSIPQNLTLKNEKDFKIIGANMARVDSKDKCLGQAEFGMDVRLKSMLYAVVARPPFGAGKLLSFDAAKAKSVDGVVDVVAFHNRVAVLANNTYAAIQGRNLLNASWEPGQSATADSAQILQSFRNQFADPGINVETRGNITEALKQSSSQVTLEFSFPFLAHAAMEPLNCTVHYKKTTAEIWSAHQMPTMDRAIAAKIFSLPEEKVTVHTTYAGGSFGRRGNKVSDYVAEACRLALLKSIPIKLVWTREDDMEGGYYRPMTLHKVLLGFEKKGQLKGWSHHVVGQSVVADSPLEAMIVQNGVERLLTEGVSSTAYRIEHFKVVHSRPKSAVTSLWWRSVGHSHTAYVMETIMDELAQLRSMDPFQMRREYLTSPEGARHRQVLDLLEEKSAWRKNLPAGRAWGLALHESFNSVVGHVAEVSISGNDIKVHRVTSAVHCGRVINPDVASAQVEGAIAFGLSAALFGELQIRSGKTVSNNFDSYPVLRMPQMPQVDVHFVVSDANPTGLGEPGLPPIAPAVANALFILTKKRLRNLPFSKELA